MLKKILLASCLLVVSIASNATVISYNGYTRTAGSNIVTGGGLEWLKWDITKGLSINDALSVYGKDGWKLASNAQMAAMFNVFQFGHDGWVDDTSSLQYVSMPWNRSEDSAHNAFLQLFGYTELKGSNFGYSATDSLVRSLAFFGSDINGGYFSYAMVQDDVSTGRGQPVMDHVAWLSSAYHSIDRGRNDVGVGLVRVVKNSKPTPVPLPGSLSLLALGIVGLGLRHRQALRRLARQWSNRNNA
ncbi:PEP-CTERM sorting domain-containing protein [Vibrio cholerae]|nr:PEP-CTERM sorting domain-containing protein [Vibrio cholerae]